jgi:hypothetical protein
MIKIQNIPKRLVEFCLGHLNFSDWDLFRASTFGFRI